MEYRNARGGLRGELLPRAVSLGFFLVLVCLGRSADGQEKNPFFERDFARNPLSEQPASGAPRNLGDGASPVPNEAPRVEAAPAAGGRSAEEEAKSRIEAMQREGQIQAGDLTALEKNHRVLSIGGVINAVDKTHFDAKLKELLEVVERYDLDVGFIWAIGSVQNLMSSPEALYLVARQGIVEAAEAAPEHYKIKMSPTWVLRTPEGEILLEATGPLAAHFNMKGEFVEKPNEMRVSRDVAAPALKPVEGDVSSIPATPVPSPSPTPDALFGGAQPKL